MKCIDSWINFLYKGDQFVVIYECYITIVRDFIRHHCNWNNDQTRIMINIAGEALNIGSSVEVTGCSKQGEILTSKICVLYFMTFLVLVVLRKVKAQNHLIFFQNFLGNLAQRIGGICCTCGISFLFLSLSPLALQPFLHQLLLASFFTTLPSVTQQNYVI